MRSFAVVMTTMPVAEKSRSATYSATSSCSRRRYPIDDQQRRARSAATHDDAEEHAEPVDAHHLAHRDDRTVVVGRHATARRACRRR